MLPQPRPADHRRRALDRQYTACHPGILPAPQHGAQHALLLRPAPLARARPRLVALRREQGRSSGRDVAGGGGSIMARRRSLSLRQLNLSRSVTSSWRLASAPTTTAGRKRGSVIWKVGPTWRYMIVRAVRRERSLTSSRSTWRPVWRSATGKGAGAEVSSAIQSPASGLMNAAVGRGGQGAVAAGCARFRHGMAALGACVLRAICPSARGRGGRWACDLA